MEWLKKLLEKHGAPVELINKMMEDTKDQNYIPKERFDEVNNSLKELKGQLADRDKQLKEIGDKVKDNEGLTKQIADLQEANKKTAGDYEAKLKDITINLAIQAKLTDTKYADLLTGKFNKSKLVVSADGTVSGIDEQLTAIKETYKDLFTPVVTGKGKPNNTGGSPNGEKNPWSKEHFNLTEQGKLFKEDPELAKSLMAQAK